MLNIPYLLKVLDTNDMATLVNNIELPPIDINLAIWAAVERGEIEVDEKKGKIKTLITPVYTCDAELADKLLAVIQHYASLDRIINRAKLNSWIKDPMTTVGYPWHDYFMALQWLIDTGKVEEHVISVPKTKNRPYHKFAFLGVPGNPNEEWAAVEVNNWIARFEEKKVK